MISALVDSISFHILSQESPFTWKHLFVWDFQTKLVIATSIGGSVNCENCHDLLT